MDPGRSGPAEAGVAGPQRAAPKALASQGEGKAVSGSDIGDGSGVMKVTELMEKAGYGGRKSGDRERQG